MNSLSKESVTLLTIDESGEAQRIDNFLFRHLKGVPKSHIYRILRGEVRVNKKRVDQTYRLKLGDLLRIPPVRVARKEEGAEVYIPALELPIIYEDDALVVINKPSGLAVHGGSGVSFGVIEQMRRARPQAKFLELVHRLDRETSGVLLLAKKRSALTAMHEIMREGNSDKRYLTLVLGRWLNVKQHVKLPLHKFDTPQGEKRVMVREGGQASHTIFTLQKNWPGFSGLESKARRDGDKGATMAVQAARQGAHAEANDGSSMNRDRGFSLLEAQLKTGRTHQIRVHLSHLGFPIAGDDKYGDFARNRELMKQGLKRMFLHAHSISFSHPLTGEPLQISAPLPPELQTFVDKLNAQED
ncbi:MAG: pseudouridine synthase [Gallionella sp.]|nr:pseudouridine synthase [Gallionella sp.]